MLKKIEVMEEMLEMIRLIGILKKKMEMIL